MADIENNMKIGYGVVGGVAIAAIIALGYKKFFQQNDTIAVGKYDVEYPGYRKVTEAEWQDPAFQADLVQAHQDGGGWPLLEEPLECSNILFVFEGSVWINGAPVVEVRYNGSQQLRGVYPAMNYTTSVAWTDRVPAAKGDDWTVMMVNPDSNPPCLFVHDSYIPSKATGLSSGKGGKKSRRRKGSRKQKRGTRNH